MTRAIGFPPQAATAGVAEVTDASANVATGNVEFLGAGGLTAVVTPGVNGKVTLTAPGTTQFALLSGAVFTGDISLPGSVGAVPGFTFNSAGQASMFGGNIGVALDILYNTVISIGSSTSLRVSNGTTDLFSVNSVGVITPSSGYSSATGAAILTALSYTSTTAYQLTDTTKDYLIYADCTTAGTAFSLSIGHTSGASDLTIISNTVAVAGTFYSFRLPAGWYYKFTYTTAAFNINAVSC